VFMVISTHHRLVAGLMAMVVGVTVVLAQSDGGKARAQEVLGQARAALGGEGRLQAIKSFSISWRLRRLMPNGDQDAGEVHFDFLLPDKFAKSETLNLSGNEGQIVNRSLLNGDQAWNDLRSANPEIPIMDMRSGGPEDQIALREGLRKEQASQLLQLLLLPSASFPFNFTYAGEAEAEDGRADVIDAKGPNDFMMRLFFDKKTHRLLLASYHEAPVMLTMQPSKPAKRSTQSSPHDDKQQDIEVQLRFSDYRAEDGILLPHLITRTKNGKPNQEAELQSFKLNPVFKPTQFEVKSKR
jgi:hypothetical protein